MKNDFYKLVKKGLIEPEQEPEKEIYTRAQRLLARHIQSNDKIPSDIYNEITTYKSLKSKFEKVLTIESRLIDKERFNLERFDKTVDLMLKTAKNQEEKN